jgi:glycosyltransferase involved in cell wall biosynthesis
MRPDDSPTPVLMAWQASNTFGWGIVALNIFCHWAVSRNIRPYMKRPISEGDLLALGPLRRLQIAERVAQSNAFAERLASTQSDAVSLDIPVIHALGNRDTGGRSRVSGTRNIGRMIFQETLLEDWPEEIKRYDAVVCACAWNADLLRARFGCEPVLIHEGVDPSLFHPAPKSGIVDPNRFYIFTGGKVEFIKAQDLTLLAFRIFAARHDDAVLVTAWHSPFTHYASGFRGKLAAAIEIGADKRPAVKKWVADNGIDPEKVIDIGPMPNQMMPHVLREMDCALAPSRAEGATNLVAMEAMACGLPVIVACNTGVKDIVDGSNCIPLMQQGAVEHPNDRGSEGWGESDVDEIVTALETLYQSSERRQEIGAAAAEFMRERTWARHAEHLGRVVLGA